MIPRVLRSTECITVSTVKWAGRHRGHRVSDGTPWSRYSAKNCKLDSVHLQLLPWNFRNCVSYLRPSGYDLVVPSYLDNADKKGAFESQLLNWGRWSHRSKIASQTVCVSFDGLLRLILFFRDYSLPLATSKSIALPPSMGRMWGWKTVTKSTNSGVVPLNFIPLRDHRHSRSISQKLEE